MSLPLSRRTILAAAAALGAGPALAAGAYWPTGEGWATVAPAQAGFDPARLEAAAQAALAANSRDVLVLRGGRIALEHYAPGWDATKSLEVASVGKSMVAVLIGMAVDDGHIKSLDQPAADFVPQWREGPRKAITLRHLMSMSSGLDDTGLALRGVTGDQFALNAAAPLKDAPGTVWHYNTAVYHLLFHVLARAVGEPFEAYAQRKLVGPLGMAQTTWLTNRGAGASGPVTNYYTALCSGRDLARFGLFAQRGGTWAGRRLISEPMWRALTTPSQDLNPSYGLLWWLNSRPGVSAVGRGAPSVRFPGAPADTVAALGAGGQIVVAVPSKDLVVIRQGGPPGGEDVLTDLVAGVVAALRSA